MEPTAVIDNEVLEITRITGKQDLGITVREAPGSVDITADECKKLCTKIGLKYFEGNETRVRQFKFTDATVDRYGDVITAKGVKLDKYKANPIVLAFHNSWWYPVGSCIKVWYDKESDSIKGWILFYDKNIDDSGFSETTFKFVSTGAVKTGSIGFIPVPGKVRRPSEQEKAEMGMGEWGYIYDEIELLEYSIVPLPANPSAMAEPITKGFTRKNLAHVLNQMKENEIFPAKQMKELMDLYDKTVAANKSKGVAMEDEAPVVIPPVAAPASVPGKLKGVLTLNLGSIVDAKHMAGILKEISEHQEKGFEVTVNVGATPAAIVKAEPIDMDKLADLIHAKAGAVLSKKNKTLVKDTVSILSKSLEALTELLKAAGAEDEDATPEEDEDDELDEDGKKKPKKGKAATQTGSPVGGSPVVKANPYGPEFLDVLNKGINDLKDAV